MTHRKDLMKQGYKSHSSLRNKKKLKIIGQNLKKDLPWLRYRVVPGYSPGMHELYVKA